MSDDVSERRGSWATIFLFGMIAVFVVLDMVLDIVKGETPGHLIVESIKLIMAFTGLAFGTWRIRRLSQALHEARQDARRWQEENRSLVQGLGEAISRQFGAWGLSDAEAEIGLLLLKGLSFQEVADVRKTSERTVREQARSVYRKSGLAGRSELAAYFLEDLLPPQLA
ncbi:MAG: LuxR C-terminal-related transcriptional regulator [Hyphomonas sp.]|nr:LuxR C-terminal-related transcriptional regulator [Hyphomonas sp.]